MSMNAEAAERHLASLPPDELRTILSRLANHTPGIVYYGQDFATNVKGIPVKETSSGDKMTPIGQALLFVACAAEDMMAEGDEVKGTITAAQHGGKVIGDWEVTARRLK